MTTPSCLSGAGQGTPGMCPPPPDRNLANLLIANASKRGINVRKTPRGYVVFQWGMSRHCGDFDSLAFILGRMGVSLP